MALADITRTDLRAALDEGRSLGREAFRDKYGAHPATRYLVDAGSDFLEPKAVAAAAHAHATGTALSVKSFSGGQAAANAHLRRLNARIVDVTRLTLEQERNWRVDTWAKVLARQENKRWLTAAEVREERIYSGASGMFYDKHQTTRLHPAGATVSVLHTGDHYPDELGADRMVYHYPDTNRGPAADAADIAATKSTVDLELPLFVVTEHETKRKLYLGWVVDYSDEKRRFEIVFDDTRPAELDFDPDDDDARFELEQKHGRRAATSTRVAGRQMFTKNVMARYGRTCPLSGIDVPEMIEAAHLRDVEADGTHDPRNGLPMHAGLHRAFDARLFAIHPDTLEVVTRPQGPSLERLGIVASTLTGLSKLPHKEALEWRYESFAARWNL